MGNLWLKVFRAQAPILDDPLLYDYIENLIFQLVLHADLRDRQLQLVVVDNPTINAFAVPGGIVGVHNGLVHQAQTEDELAAVLTKNRTPGPAPLFAAARAGAESKLTDDRGVDGGHCARSDSRFRRRIGRDDSHTSRRTRFPPTVFTRQ